MMTYDPKQRPTAREMLEHEWVREGGLAGDNVIEPEVLHRLRSFAAMNKLKKQALLVSAWLPWLKPSAQQHIKFLICAAWSARTDSVVAVMYAACALQNCTLRDACAWLGGRQQNYNAACSSHSATATPCLRPRCITKHPLVLLCAPFCSTNCTLHIGAYI